MICGVATDKTPKKITSAECERKLNELWRKHFDARL
jgi:hypothetical protein